MGSVLGWPPVVRAMPLALLVLLAGCSYVYLLLIFRPAHVPRMLEADIPRVRDLGAEVAGTRDLWSSPRLPDPRCAHPALHS